MTKEKYLEDLKDIKDIMERSSRFITLSGLSGVMAGVIAIIGAYLAYQTVYFEQDYFSYRKATNSLDSILQLLLIALGVLILSLAFGFFFTRRKAKRQHLKLWDKQAERLLVNLMIPLTAGGILCVILLFKGFIGLVAPLTLVFYGLALVNASKYTLSEIRGLGLFEVIIGLIGCQFVGYGLLLWGIGFGVMHIIYGIVMYLKYER